MNNSSGLFFLIKKFMIMSDKEEWLTNQIGVVEVGGKVEIENISLHKFDSMHGNYWYEMQIIAHFKTVWNNDIEITHSTRLRHKLNVSEVENLQEKGIIRIDIEEYKKFLKK